MDHHAMRRERRKNVRVAWRAPAAIDHGRLTHRCVLVDFSNGGAKIAGVRGETISDEFSLLFAGGGRRCRVLYRSTDTLRVKFIDQTNAAETPKFKQPARTSAL